MNVLTQCSDVFFIFLKLPSPHNASRLFAAFRGNMREVVRANND